MYLKALWLYLFPNSSTMEFEQGKVLSLKMPFGSIVDIPRKKLSYVRNGYIPEETLPYF